MEIIVNAYYSSHNAETMVGSFLGHGYINNHNNKFSSSIEEGQLISHYIDEFIQKHPLCRKSIDLISPKARKYAHTILRLYYDHLLARNWDQYGTSSYEDFCAEIIGVMKEHNSLFPYKPKRVANRIIKKKGILELRTINGLNQYIQDMTRYNSYNSSICESVGDLVKNYDTFNRDFREIFPEMEKEIAYKTEKLVLSQAS
ncbi:MAG TPA: ACP phosphodiesterase [Cytophagaceae bacterium]|nr:ACP phosphodiesterase [Cytophagaceae bacterium]